MAKSIKEKSEALFLPSPFSLTPPTVTQSEPLARTLIHTNCSRKDPVGFYSLIDSESHGQKDPPVFPTM